MARDPYKYFRVEASELLEGLGQGVLELERTAAPKETVARLLRLAHTLKGAARVVKQVGIAGLAHGIEDVLSPYQNADAQVPAECVNLVLRLVDDLASRMPTLGPADHAPKVASSPQPTEETLETIRVEIAKIDALLESISEADAQVTRLHQQLKNIEQLRQQTRRLFEQVRLRGSAESNGGYSSTSRLRELMEQVVNSLDDLRRSLGENIDDAAVELMQARERASLLRLIPASIAFPSLERAVRDAAQSVEKQATFEAAGGDVRLDAHVLARIRQALLHVVRNAVAHGIEGEAERLSAGKPAVGRVDLRVERRATELHSSAVMTAAAWMSRPFGAPRHATGLWLGLKATPWKQQTCCRSSSREE